MPRGKSIRKGKGKASPLEKALAKKTKRLDELAGIHIGLSNAVREMKANFHPRYSDPSEIKRHERTLRKIEREAEDLETGEVEHPIVKEIGYLYHHGSVPKITIPVAKHMPKSKLSMEGGGYKLRKAPKRDAYWVVGLDGRHHSKEPLSLEMAKKQLTALNIASAKKGGRIDAMPPPPPPPPPHKRPIKSSHAENMTIAQLDARIRQLELQIESDKIALDFIFEGMPEYNRLQLDIAKNEQELALLREQRASLKKTKQGSGLMKDRLEGESKMLIKDLMTKYKIPSYAESVVQAIKDDVKRKFKEIGTSSLSVGRSMDKEQALEEGLAKIEAYMKTLIPKLDVKHMPSRYSEVHDYMPHLSYNQELKQKKGLLQARTGGGKFKDELYTKIKEVQRNFVEKTGLPFDISKVSAILQLGEEELTKYGKSHGSPTLEEQKYHIVQKWVGKAQKYFESLIPVAEKRDVTKEYYARTLPTYVQGQPLSIRRGGKHKSKKC